MTIGTQLASVFKETQAFFSQKLAELGVTNIELPTSFGYGIGLELKEPYLSINEKSTHTIAKGEVYFV